MGESELEMVTRHVAEGTDQVFRQRRMVAELISDGHDDSAQAARDLLRLLEESLGLHMAHLARLLGQVG